MIGEKERVHMNLARLKRDGENFEIDIDPDLALKFKKGEQVDIREILKAEKVFSDAQKGLLASQEKMKAVFETDDPLEVAKEIIMHGEIQLTAEHRAQLREQKKKRLFSLIQRFGVDPRTKAPHPINRVESAFEEAKVKIDYNKTAEDQIKEVLRQLQPILPISFEKKKIQLEIGVNYASKCYAIIKALGTVLEESWGADGSWSGTVQIPGGMEQELYDKLQKITHGSLQAQVIE